MSNFLFITQFKDPTIGGVERVTNELINTFNKRGGTCFLAYYHNEDKTDLKNFYFSEKTPTKDLINRFLPFVRKNKIEIIINQDQNLPNIIELIKYLKSFTDIKLINCHHNQPDFPKYWHTSFRYKITEFLYRIRKGYPSYATPYRDLYNNTHRFVLLSESFIPLAKHCLGLKDGTRFCAISNPIPKINLNDIIPFTKKKKQFLIVSRLFDHQKNISAALRIWNKFEKLNNDYNLIIAGTGPDEIKLKEYSQKLGNLRVSFIGHHRNPAILYNESQFFMMTSRYEGFGMTLIEAQQYGCIPIVFNSYLSLHDIITNNVNGFIVQNKRENRYVTVMNNAVNKHNIEDISTNAQANVSRFYSDVIVRKWISLINDIINETN